MKSESEIREKLENVDIHGARGPDQSHRIGFRNALRWVLDEGQ
jgi:hypothetical protein